MVITSDRDAASAMPHLSVITHTPFLADLPKMGVQRHLAHCTVRKRMSTEFRVCVREIERETERDRDRERDTERERDRDRQTETER